MNSVASIGIIGGNGKMGQWFRRFFEERGSKVLVSDLAPGKSPKEIIPDVDIVLVSVPISKTEEVIREFANILRPDQMLADLTSIKGPAVKAMLESRAEVLGLHPLFGPQIPSMEGQIIVTCRARTGKWTPYIESLFQSAGAKIKDATPEAHDRMMAVIQGLTHFNAIAVAHSLKSLGVSIDETLQYASPIYRLRMDMIGRVMAQDSTLYSEIAILNPETEVAIDAYRKSSETLLDLIRRKDLHGFGEYFEESSRYLGDFSKEALEESNFLIEALQKMPKSA